MSLLVTRYKKGHLGAGGGAVTPFFSSSDIGTAFAKPPVVYNSKGVTRVEILILVVGLCVDAAVLPKVPECVA